MVDPQFVQQLTEFYQKEKPSRADLDAFCQEMAKAYKFDCVFLAHSHAPEAPLVPRALTGKEEVMDACLYRLGVEERVALSRLPLKNYVDITGKPIFNKAGSLRIQKPSSGIFMALTRPKQDFLVLCLAHQDSRGYDQDLLTELDGLWKSCQAGLLGAVGRVRSPFPEERVPEGPLVPSPVREGPAPSSAPPAEKDVHPMRPIVLVDEVTRLFNKDYFEECLAIEVERAKRYSRNVSLLFLSVTPVDRSEEAKLEDRVAPKVADVLYKSLRRVDILCRIDRDRYAIILPDTDNNTYGIIAKRIFRFFKQVFGDAPPVFLNVSASTYPKHAGNHLLLFENTEKLLDQARKVGPNKAVLPE